MKATRESKVRVDAPSFHPSTNYVWHDFRYVHGDLDERLKLTKLGYHNNFLKNPLQGTNSNLIRKQRYIALVNDDK